MAVLGNAFANHPRQGLISIRFAIGADALDEWQIELFGCAATCVKQVDAGDRRHDRASFGLSETAASMAIGAGGITALDAQAALALRDQWLARGQHAHAVESFAR